ncbi:PREDICTED: geranylgeranyl transferase type-2 subunit alpha [Papilio polytes]|uniref:geranylgeranyl transferase type-2 subunit alpha n=1 Tax=Papilio polytes TaxID=76194 RepID=UPI000675E456|nr:PREDICTED: geranylgeranyl transferase type-2 subunit alpha [Papilio polytes]
MHGRVKVRTTEEEKARIEKERQEKVKVFKKLMLKIQDKRKENELDTELLELTGKVLMSNPDINTLWNIRREIFLHTRKDYSEEDLKKMYDDELSLTEYCLKKNPKSYCAWHQRMWVLTTRSDPDWKNELDLCNTYLKLDERNFHTWNYRRFVVGQCKPPLQDEFDYTTEKLLDNFSNYSAWHYRSKMLLQLYPDVEGGRPIQDIHHKHELKMVINAAFTDPDDTSAWFYQRWLLGAVKTSINLVACTMTESKITVAFSKPVPLDYVQSSTQIFINNNVLNGEWVSCCGYQYDSLWILKHKVDLITDTDVKAEYENENKERIVIKCMKYKDNLYIGKGKVSFENKYSQPVIEELNDQLKSCRQLLVLEPDNKWTLLTTTVFLHCIDAKLNHKEAINNLQILQKLDYQRAGYYNDLISKWCIEEQLPIDYSSNCLLFKPKMSDKLTCLPHLQYYSFCEEIDLSNQNLCSKVLPSLILLQHCKVLILRNNKLNTLKGFPNIELEKLDLQDNGINVEEVEQFKKDHKFVVIF